MRGRVDFITTQCINIMLTYLQKHQSESPSWWSWSSDNSRAYPEESYPGRCSSGPSPWGASPPERPWSGAARRPWQKGSYPRTRSPAREASPRGTPCPAVWPPSVSDRRARRSHRDICPADPATMRTRGRCQPLSAELPRTAVSLLLVAVRLLQRTNWPPGSLQICFISATRSRHLERNQ